MTISRVPTGIGGLDSLIEGGFPRGSLVLLAGNPGSGKTMFSARYLHHGLKLNEPGLYVSFAENRETFLANMRRIGLDFEKYVSQKRFEFLDLFTVKEQGIEIILESIMGVADASGAKRLVIDSFSALAQAFKDPIDVRVIVHTVLSRIVRKSDCTTIMIEEVPLGESKIGYGVEEFVADAVIVLKTGELDGRPLRDLEIVKIRGTELVEKKLVFTLKDCFRVFQPFRLKPVEKQVQFQPIPDPPGRFSTGTPDLDAMLGGGIPRGSTVLLEKDEKTSRAEYDFLMAPLAMNFAAQGRGVLILPSVLFDYGAVREMVLSYGLSEKVFQSQIVLLDHQRLPHPEDVRPNVVQLKGVDAMDDLLNVLESVTWLKSGRDQPALVSVSLDAGLSLYGEAQGRRLLDLTASTVRGRASLFLLVGRESPDNLTDKISSIVDFHLKLTREHGSLLLYGVKPRTPLYAVETDTSKGYPIPRLTPIV